MSSRLRKKTTSNSVRSWRPSKLPTRISRMSSKTRPAGLRVWRRIWPRLTQWYLIWRSSWRACTEWSNEWKPKRKEAIRHCKCPCSRTLICKRKWANSSNLFRNWRAHSTPEIWRYQRLENSMLQRWRRESSWVRECEKCWPRTSKLEPFWVKSSMLSKAWRRKLLNSRRECRSEKRNASGLRPP